MMDNDDFVASKREHHASAVQDATRHAFETCRGGDLVDAYLTLAWELQRRGIEPEPPAVFDAAVLIARGEPPAMLHEDPFPRPGRRRRDGWST